MLRSKAAERSSADEAVANEPDAKRLIPKKSIATEPGFDPAAANRYSAHSPIGAYLKSREGKRWTREDTRAILARAAELDRIVERLINLAGIPLADVTEPANGALPLSLRAS